LTIQEKIVALETNPHLRYGIRYQALFEGVWRIEGDLGQIANPEWWPIHSVNTLGIALEPHHISLMQGDFSSFPDFSYMVVLTQESLLFIFGLSPLRTTRRAISRDLSQSISAPTMNTMSLHASLGNGSHMLRYWNSMMSKFGNS
jgi:hypothetical protein